MARPKKQTVDYFPHNCKHGKTMFILEQKYGNDGYAFWFKLLELLGSSEGHYLKLRNPADWEYLTATTRLQSETCEEILNLLSILEAIDADAWQQRIVWCDKFVENIKEAYRNRIVDLPTKPDCLRKKPGNDRDNLRKKPLNEMKVNETKDKRSLSEKFSDDSLEMKMAVYMKERILETYPGAKIPTNLNAWCGTLDRLMRIDGRTKEQIAAVMKWIYADEFWCTNIRSPEKLREKWDTIWLQMQKQAVKKGDQPKLKPGQRPGESDAEYIKRTREERLNEAEGK